MATHSHGRYQNPEKVEKEIRQWVTALRRAAGYMKQGVTAPYALQNKPPVRIPANRQARAWGGEALENAAAVLTQALEKRKLAQEIERSAAPPPGEGA